MPSAGRLGGRLHPRSARIAGAGGERTPGGEGEPDPQRRRLGFGAYSVTSDIAFTDVIGLTTKGSVGGVRSVFAQTSSGSSSSSLTLTAGDDAAVSYPGTGSATITFIYHGTDNSSSGLLGLDLTADAATLFAIDYTTDVAGSISVIAESPGQIHSVVALIGPGSAVVNISFDSFSAIDFRRSLEPGPPKSSAWSRRCLSRRR